MAEPNNGKKLAEVMAEIKKQPNGLAEFAADPVGYLQRKGINADGLTLSAEPSPSGPAGYLGQDGGRLDGGEVTDADLAMVAGGGCFGVGYYGCYNEGD